MTTKTHILICSLFFFINFAVSAHHFKGLPHFNYFENYPQVPQEEYLAQEGNFEFSLVLYDFQGINRKDTEQPNDARLYLAIYNLRKNIAYKGKLIMEILDGEKSILKKYFKSSEEESLYAMQEVLPQTGDYSLRITMLDLDNETAIIPFLLSSQKINWGKWVGLFLMIIIIIVAIGSRQARILQDRKDALKK